MSTQGGSRTCVREASNSRVHMDGYTARKPKMLHTAARKPDGGYVVGVGMLPSELGLLREGSPVKLRLGDVGVPPPLGDRYVLVCHDGPEARQMTEARRIPGEFVHVVVVDDAIVGRVASGKPFRVKGSPHKIELLLFRGASRVHATLAYRSIGVRWPT